MKPSPREELEVKLAASMPEEVELLVSTDKRRPDMDDEIDEHLIVDPYNGDPPSRRKDAELSKILSLLDSIESERGSH